MPAEYVTSVSSAAATFSGPNMDQGSFGILVQASDSLSHGAPTWGGQAMTLALDKSGQPVFEGCLSIYYIVYPPAGVQTIARGSGVEFCTAIQAKGVKFTGSYVRDTDTSGAQGAGSFTLTLTDITSADFLVSALTLDEDDYQGLSTTGVQTQIASGDMGSDSIFVAYAINQSGSVGMGWDITDTCDGNAIAVGFVGGYFFGGAKGII